VDYTKWHYGLGPYKAPTYLFLNPLGIIFDSYRHIEKVRNPIAYKYLKDSLHFLKGEFESFLFSLQILCTIFKVVGDSTFWYN